jgi:outer membrane receptor protein involved in Fe transport
MKPTPLRSLALLALCCLLASANFVAAQGVTSGSISGRVVDPQDQAVPGATILAVHEPSGTRYEAVSRADGRFSIQGMRIGGPYTVQATMSGFQPKPVKGVNINLGVATDLTLGLSLGVSEEITVSAEGSDVFSSGRTGAATTVAREALATLPTINDRINDFARLTPQYTNNGPGGFPGSFGGMDSRYNNITVDGSYFNNSFGLQGQPGDRTGVAPIAMEAVQEIQVNVAPYDVRQGNFVGAGINSVTRTGDNEFRGAAYYWFRDNDLVGTEAKGLTYNPGTFDFGKWGGWVSGPVVKNKLFFFGNYEDETYTRPGTTFRANTGGETAAGSVTRVKASDLDALSSFLSSKFSYDTGPYQNYDFETPAKRYLAKLTYNLNDRNKISVRYNQLDSITDVLLSNSSSLGFGTRNTNLTGLNFQNSNYQIMENIKSGIAEWNSVLGSNRANTLIVGYTHQDESRKSRGELFPMVDILDASTVYTTFGFEPFTPNNELRYNTFQFQDNFTWNRGNHSFVAGASVERYKSENVFYPGSQSAYVYNSLADFYADANDYLANPNRTTSPITLRRFQVRWINIPGLDKPTQPLGVWYSGLYAMDEWQWTPRVKVTYGLRVDLPIFDDTGFDNPAADALTFRAADGSPVHYNSGKLPDANLLWSPRVGFNWDVDGQRTTQVRGGTGVFTGRPAYVWISNQIGNTGMLTGFEQQDNTKNRPFNPDPKHYFPATVTGAPASSYELALTEPDFKFPQVWRSNLAVDRKLPWNMIGTAEFMYTKDVNGISYVNVDLPAAQTAFVGADTRPRWTNNKIYANVANATVLGNENDGHSYNISAAVQKNYRAGFLKAAYSYSQAKNLNDPGSIASGSWTGNQIALDPNNPDLAYSAQGHRAFLAGSYRFDYKGFGSTTLSFFFEGYNNGFASYTYAGDLNGDGGTSNDLLYIPRDTSEMNFQAIPATATVRAFTPAEQATAWDAYISQDPYLSKHRGEYAGRAAVLLPMVWRLDFSIAQDLFKNMGGRRHALTFRADFLNFSNLLNHDWGVGQRLVNAQPLTNPGADAQGRALYRMRVVNGQLMNHTFETTTNLTDVYRMQFSIKYSFN